MTQFVIQGLKTEIIEAEKSRIGLLKWKLGAIAALGSIGLGLKDEVNIFAPQFTLCLIPLVCCYVDLLCKHLNLRMLVINKFVTISSKLNIGEEEPLKLYQHYEKFCNGLRENGQEKKDFIVALDFIVVLILIFGKIFSVIGLIFLFNLLKNKDYCSLDFCKNNIGIYLIFFVFVTFVNFILYFILDHIVLKQKRVKQKRLFANRTFALEDLAQEWSTILCSIFIIIIGLILVPSEADNNLIKIYLIFSGSIGLLLTYMISLAYQNKIRELEKSSEKYIKKIVTRKCKRS